MNEITIDGKKYNYFLKREHTYLFTKILGKLDIDYDVKEIKSINEIITVIKMVQNALFNFETTDKESMDFICAIYDIKAEEIKEKEFHKFELKLWENLFRDEELVSFFSHVFKSRMAKKQEAQKKVSQKKKT